MTHYLYDQQDILATFDDAGHEIARYTHGPGIDEPLAEVGHDHTRFYHADVLGSVIALSDRHAHAIRDYHYSAFGIPENHKRDSQPYRFTGREWDRETGLYYYRARYYSPQMGRFIQEDRIPLGSGDTNLYSYVFNRPLMFTDPSGHFLTTIAGALGGAVIGAAFGAIGAALAEGDLGQIGAGALNGALSGGLTGLLVGSGVPLPVAAGVGSLVTQTAVESLNGTLGTDTAALRIGLSAAIGAGLGTLGSQIVPAAGLPGRILVSGTTGLYKTIANGILSDIDALEEEIKARTEAINRAINCP